MPQVSIVIVCMNNLGNLYPCLDSIKKYTSVSYETLVVAYLFSEDNKEKLKSDYPWITIIESDEIRGFSENNNLALRQAKGEYCFVVNDDTLMHEPVIDRLVESFNHVPGETAIVSPVLRYYATGEVQRCGRPQYNWIYFILDILHLRNDKKKGRFVNGIGLFQTYNISGAAFLIKTKIFEQMDWFDEYYFFGPEDIALSTKINECGYSCYVNADTSIMHRDGMSGKSLSMIQTATKPATAIGNIKFLSNGNNFIRCFLYIIIFFVWSSRFIIHRIIGSVKPKPNVHYILSIGELNTIVSLFQNKSPKEIFIKYYSKIKAKS